MTEKPFLKNSEYFFAMTLLAVQSIIIFLDFADNFLLNKKSMLNFLFEFFNSKISSDFDFTLISSI